MSLVLEESSWYQEILQQGRQEGLQLRESESGDQLLILSPEASQSK